MQTFFQGVSPAQSAGKETLGLAWRNQFLGPHKSEVEPR